MKENGSFHKRSCSRCKASTSWTVSFASTKSSDLIGNKSPSISIYFPRVLITYLSHDLNCLMTITTMSLFRVLWAPTKSSHQQRVKTIHHRKSRSHMSRTTVVPRIPATTRCQRCLHKSGVKKKMSRSRWNNIWRRLCFTATKGWSWTSKACGSSPTSARKLMKSSWTTAKYLHSSLYR